MPEQMNDCQILIVDDNLDNLEILERRLQRYGFRTASASGGKQAIDLGLKLRPDLVLMDLEMPVVSGFDALKALRADPSTASIPILAVTGHATPETQRECEAAGFNAFIAKPVQIKELLSMIYLAGLKPGAPVG